MNLKALLFVAISLLSFQNIAKAQSDTTYYDHHYNEISRFRYCYYYRITTATSEGRGEVKEFYKDHQVKFTCGLVIRDSEKINDGDAVSYYENGRKKNEGVYLMGQMTGDWKFYYETGTLREEGHYANDSLNGRLHTYYKNGKLKREEDFEHGVSLGGKCFDESGKQIPFFPYRVWPEFPGGLPALYQFLGQNIRYPEKARSKNIEGKVIVRFVVTRDGSLDDFHILQHVRYGCDEEVIRVMKLMPKWKPGEQEGEKVDVFYKLPVSFRLE
ncbi:energy transducer TonB [Taibaiella soli]|uniref:TonB C-terminal domain-containing protein n=1 Tax=Taibaiella soli TaxID=1649169 RepID=A0A2W2BZQ6_9BACT|nr:energy transducer TonB [Taibaiella soli]PZF73343.1 hypothetical protein DN068_08100 [Taibaiella soli]